MPITAVSSRFTLPPGWGSAGGPTEAPGAGQSLHAWNHHFSLSTWFGEVTYLNWMNFLLNGELKRETWWFPEMTWKAERAAAVLPALGGAIGDPGEQGVGAGHMAPHSPSALGALGSEQGRVEFRAGFPNSCCCFKTLEASYFPN